MKQITILLTKPKNHIFPILSYLIRFMEKTKYSHVLIKWHSDTLERDLYFEATGHGVNFLSSKLIDTKYTIIEKFDYDIKDLKNIAQFCHDNSGKNYGRKQMLGLLMIRICKLFGYKIANPFRDGDHS